MTKAKAYMSNKYGICDMCSRDTELNYYVVRKVQVCSKCYNGIPDYIPINQDSQYIQQFKEKRIQQFKKDNDIQ